MAKILTQYPNDMEKRDAYRLTRATAKKMKEAAGSVINPEKFVLYEDADAKSGEIKTVLTVEAEGEVFGTISPTFIREFVDAAEEFGGTPGPIKVIVGESKNGREYVTCEIV